MCSRCQLLNAVALLFGVLPFSLSLWPAESLSFAGLSPRTTVEAAKKRYPRSSFRDRHVYISEEDSHDHIYGLDLADSGNARVRIWFERHRREHHQYPRCEQVVAVITKQYGQPAVVQEFDEERCRNRRLIWRHSEEELSLLCFRMGRQPFFAADLTITSGQ